MVVKKTNLIFIVFLPLIFMASFNLLSVQPDYLSYKYIYETGTVTEPIFYIANKIFSSMGMPFKYYHFIVTSFALYYFISFLAKNKVNYLIILLSCTMFYVYHLAAHWRTGLALGLISFLLYKYKANLRLTLLIASTIHISALTNLLSYQLSRYLILFALSSVILNFFAEDLLIFIGPTLFEALGRGSFYLKMTLALSGEEYYIHRSILSFSNLRIYFVLIISFLLFRDFRQNRSVLINLAFVGSICYLLFLFNAYLSQKSFLLVTPILIAATSRITKKSHRWAGVMLAVTSSAIDFHERYTNTNLAEL